MNCYPQIFLVLAFLQTSVFSSSLLAETADSNKPEIILKVTSEDSQKVILATVTAQSKPLGNVTVSFFVKRTFGNLGIGHDVTLDDGTAAVPFPTTLPGGVQGKLDVIAVITDPNRYSSVRGEATFGGALIVPHQEDVFPRTLWTPQAPLALILTIAILVAAVWGTYLYVIVQIFRIRKGGTL
jgi:hypothetical protein